MFISLKRLVKAVRI